MLKFLLSLYGHKLHSTAPLMHCHKTKFATITRPVIGTGQLTWQRLAHHIKNFNVKRFANADATADTDANARGSTIALPGLRPGELKADHLLPQMAILSAVIPKFIMVTKVTYYFFMQYHRVI